MISAIVLVSCSGQGDRVPGSVVNIPNTASGNTTQAAMPEFAFEKTAHDFGKVIQGERVTYSFRFTNSGNADLVIANISASCGCTATDYPKIPIKPGETNAIKLTFDSGGRSGFQSKTVTVAANTQPGNTVLTIKAQVISPEKK